MRIEIAAGAALGAALAAGLLTASATGVDAPAQASVRVIDGDTLDIAGERIRLQGVDAPETFRARCAEERRLGERATAKLESLVQGRALSVRRSGTDRYDRTLADVYADGVNVGEALIEAGVAAPWRGRSRNWCA